MPFTQLHFYYEPKKYRNITYFIFNAVEKFARCLENVPMPEQIIEKDNRQIPTFQELWKYDNLVYTDSKEEPLISHSELRFDDDDNNRNVQERFVYYYRPEDIPDMIKAWQGVKKMTIS